MIKVGRIFLFSVVLQACIVAAPKYTRVEKVMQLSTGMTKHQVEKLLSVEPYQLYSMDKDSNRVFLYKYRVTDRRTLPFCLRDTNGYEFRGKFADLLVTYNKSDTVTSMQSQQSDSEIQKSRIDINALVTTISVTVPSLLVYLGLRGN
jgi:hypothetical protein